MKIAMISYWSCPRLPLGVLSSGGMNVYLTSLANNLSLLGHKVDIYTRTHKEHGDERVVIEPHINLIHVPPSTVSEAGVEKFSHKVLSLMEKEKQPYDILHAHYYYSGLAAARIKEQTGIPFVQTFHTLAVMKEIYAGVKDQKRLAAERYITSRANALLANTVYEKKELIEYYGASEDKVFVIPPGVDHDVFLQYDKQQAREKLRLPKTKKIILFVGRIDPVKDLTTLIKAVARLINTFPNFEDQYRVLLIGGDITTRKFWQNEEVKRLKRLIDENELTCCVKFIGSKPHEMLPYYYSASDVVVMPSVYESFGLVVIEAMASGAAVIASKVGGLKYLIEDGVNGSLFPSGDDKTLASRLWELLNDEQKRKKLSINARRFSDTLCWDKQAKKIATLYNRYI